MSAAPLDGVVVLEAAERVVGPLAGLHLRLLGADVVKLEPPGGDAARRWGEGGVFSTLNAGKRLLPETETLDAALADVDVAIVDEGPAADAARTAISTGAGRLRAVVVIEAAVPGAHGTSETVAQGAMAFTDYVGDPDGPPARIGADLGDATAGVQAAQAALAGLLPGREGTVATVSTARALSTMKTIHLAGRTDPSEWDGYHVTGRERPPDQGYQAADGRMSFEFPPNLADGWRTFCQRLGLDDFVEEVGDDWYSTVAMGERSDWARPRYEAALAKVTRDEAVELARSLGGWAVPFLTPTEALRHPQTARYGAASLADGHAAIRPPWQLGGVEEIAIDDEVAGGAR